MIFLSQTPAPFEYLTAWDFGLLLLGVLMRFLITIRAKMDKHKDDFSFRAYFDAQHFIRWFTHIVVSFVAVLVLPEIIIKYFLPKYAPEVQGWALIGSVALGFAGYDLIRIIEKVGRFIARKKGININVALLALVLTLPACFPNPRARERKAKRKLEQAEFLAPHLFTTDTVVFRDTLYITNYQTDTITKYELHDTTTVINNERITVRYFIDTSTREIHHFAECKGDTVFVEIHKEIPSRHKGEIIPAWVLLSFVALAFGSAFVFFKKRNGDLLS